LSERSQATLDLTRHLVGKWNTDVLTWVFSAAGILQLIWHEWRSTQCHASLQVIFLWTRFHPSEKTTTTTKNRNRRTL